MIVFTQNDMEFVIVSNNIVDMSANIRSQIDVEHDEKKLQQKNLFLFSQKFRHGIVFELLKYFPRSPNEIQLRSN